MQTHLGSEPAHVVLLFFYCFCLVFFQLQIRIFCDISKDRKTRTTDRNMATPREFCALGKHQWSMFTPPLHVATKHSGHGNQEKSGSCVPWRLHYTWPPSWPSEWPGPGTQLSITPFENPGDSTVKIITAFERCAKMFAKKSRILIRFELLCRLTGCFDFVWKSAWNSQTSNANKSNSSSSVLVCLHVRYGVLKQLTKQPLWTSTHVVM